MLYHISVIISSGDYRAITNKPIINAAILLTKIFNRFNKSNEDFNRCFVFAVLFTVWTNLVSAQSPIKQVGKITGVTMNEQEVDITTENAFVKIYYTALTL